MDHNRQLDLLPWPVDLMEQPISVLHVTQPGSEGVGNFVRDLARQQAARGLEVTVAGPPDSPLAEAMVVHGIELMPWMADRRPGPAMSNEKQDLARIIGAVRPHLVHLHSAKAGAVGRVVLRGRLPTVFQPHAWSFEALTGTAARMALRWERVAGRWTHAIVAVSAAEQAVAERQGIAPLQVMATIPNPVDVDRFRPHRGGDPDLGLLRRSLGLDRGPLVVSVGRLCRQKGQDILLGAWPRVLETLPDAALLLVGDGPSRAELEALDRRNVRFLGNRIDVAELLRLADVAVLPSRWEGMSLAMLEAMASATPVVVSDVGGAAETAGDGAGAVVAVGDERGLAREVLRRLEDRTLAAREGRVGRSIATSRHTLHAVVEQLDALYRSLLVTSDQILPAPAGPRSLRAADG